MQSCVENFALWCKKKKKATPKKPPRSSLRACSYQNPSSRHCVCNHDYFFLLLKEVLQYISFRLAACHTSLLPPKLVSMGLFDYCYIGLSSSVDFYSKRRKIFLELTPYSNLKNISIQFKNCSNTGKFHVCIKKEFFILRTRTGADGSYRISITADIQNSAG